MRRALLAIGLAAAALAGPAAAQDGSVTIYFEQGQSALSKKAEAEVETFAELFRTSGDMQVMIAGHTARMGETKANDDLAWRRANAVRAQLASGAAPMSNAGHHRA